ncbi:MULTISPECIES: carbohydrate ABC transporter permease [Streptomyces]|uniref:Carbohydrate ABC transporter permease n=1 Tax=Streptomyces silvae TaxID=2803812 RepID=A0ABU7ZV43_9ACTN|nr:MULTISPECIES: carbohydrate ABC transporter permease [unclassified Streptomyces]WSS60031.1 carbohydrate ABC transporter permease [Streptomyces sp. NBC_01177]WSS67135.1 carbohydrate ABC transporter permease [Streptomyces sp. NBC_01175]WSS74050.1 carbohydrate ABC transporter permease [Streptomyces sp. NBC_01174]MDX3325416.1 carbohydrate ABC transporter permease [Streptomyces sp. ME02-6979-3A]MDX3428363.1 carbohydrate ABC transporter permease [Streptomyces sp. ME01-18a]
MASSTLVSRRGPGRPGSRKARRRDADLGRQRTLISPAQLGRPRGKAVYWIVFALVVVAFTLAFLGPLYWMVTGGLKTTQEVVQSPPTAFPSSIHTENYSQAWNVMDLAQLLFNTLYYAFGALAFQLVLDVAAAYSLSKLRPMFGKVILGMMLATLMIPATVLVVPQYLTVLDVPIFERNLLNSPWAIWLPSVTNAFNIFLLKRFFDSVPGELLDAAAIDGASPLRTLRSIILPISRPILGVVSIFAVVGVWKDFLWPMLTLPDPGKQTLNVGIYSLSNGVPTNVLIAALTIASVPTLLIFLLFQRNIMSGLTAGGLKG